MRGNHPKPILWDPMKKHIKLLRPIDYQASYFAITKLKNMQINRGEFDFARNNTYIIDHDGKIVNRSTKARYIHMSIKETDAACTFSDNKYYISLYPDMDQPIDLVFTKNDMAGMKGHAEGWI